MPLCLTFIDSKKAFDIVETEAVIEALGNKCVRQGDTISPKLFSAAFEKIMRHIEREGMGVKVGDSYLHQLQQLTTNIEQAERMLAYLAMLVERSA
ncbi:hypothetical protein V3C99_017939 [Haemonchus contortus]|uniref:Reverse transcriptase domain-containing protein n=1 Tax=Haemonchus contortus TaxID=6289 RepID=A0A7I5EEA3_HAECO